MGDDTAKFAREWNFAFLLVALVAALLVADGRAVLGVIAGGLCVVAIVARWCAMRKQGRRFYGQQKQAR
jgi:branched-subunit amino acid transport protein